MPAPATVAELLDLVQKSGVADAARLKAYLAKLPEQAPTEPAKFAGLLVRDGLLTYFQAEQLLQGKWKRFTIGKYKVLEKLGAGGMGQVFLCEHKLMRRRVAVKVLPTAKAADEASLKRFFREAQAVAAVDHPNIVRAFDIDQDENLHFLVMEYVDGINFQDLVKKFGPLDVVRACHYIYAAAVGLQHAHEIGLVHRDIKPGNILVDRTGVVKILDMGLARFFHDEADNLTKQYDENILGTADYLSPEQAEDSHGVDIRTDLYSLGATFYFLLTGSQPFPTGTIPQKLIWHRTRDPQPIRDIRPEVPEEVAAIVSRMMAKKPEDRFQTPAEVMAALTPWAATPIPPPPAREMPQLSPALAGGGSGSGRGPASQVARSAVSGGPGGSGALLVAPAGPPASTSGSGDDSAPAVPPPGGVWESLVDTTTDTANDTGRRDRGHDSNPKSARVRPDGTPGRPRLTPVALVAGGVLAAAVAAGGAFLLFFNKGATAPTAAEKPAARRLVVSKAGAGADNTFATLRDAILKAAPGDTVVIADSPHAEASVKLDRRLKDLTIESGLPGGKAAVIEFVAAGSGPAAMLDLSSAENVRVKDLELDGRGVADFGVQVSGVAPGVVVENVTVRNVKAAGFRLHNAAGDAARPVTLDQVRVLVGRTNEAGVLIEATGPLETKYVAVRNSRFEGPGKAGVRIDGAAAGVDVIHNRLHDLDAAFALGRVTEGRPFKVQLAQNTVADAKAGLRFGPAPPGGAGKVDVAVARNYFVRTAQLARSDAGAVAGVTATDNARDKESQDGNVPLAAKPIDAPPLLTNPDDNAAFLRLPGNTGPSLGSGVRVGAN